MDPTAYDVFAVELSSFQLHYTDSMRAESAAVLDDESRKTAREFRMALEVYDLSRLRTAGAVRHNYDILPAWLQAMRRSEHEVARDRGPSARCAAAADHDHYVARNRLGRGLRSPNNSSRRRARRWTSGSAWTRSSTCSAAGGSARPKPGWEAR